MFLIPLGRTRAQKLLVFKNENEAVAATAPNEPKTSFISNTLNSLKFWHKSIALVVEVYGRRRQTFAADFICSIYFGNNTWPPYKAYFMPFTQVFTLKKLYHLHTD